MDKMQLFLPLVLGGPDMTKEPKNPFIANKPAHWRALNSPVRNAILQLLISSGPTTVPVIAEQLGRKPKSLYRHVDILLKAGLLVQTGVQPTGRRAAAEYGFQAPASPYSAG